MDVSIPCVTVALSRQGPRKNQWKSFAYNFKKYVENWLIKIKTIFAPKSMVGTRFLSQNQNLRDVSFIEINDDKFS